MEGYFLDCHLKATCPGLRNDVGEIEIGNLITKISIEIQLQTTV